MKKNFIPIFSVLLVALTIISCRKDYPSQDYHSRDITYSATTRKIRFQLYTTQDFSSNSSMINFSILIRTARKTLLDSALAPMQIKDIPDANHKIVIEKTVSNDSDLAASFRYEIQNVGFSWYIDTSKAGNKLKIVDYDFQ